jgi:5-methyltetrahydropteroyltriglutamate--homocysteine methyltransferase
MMPAVLRTTIAGSLPKPAWLAKPELLWAPWLLPPERLAEGQRDAVILALVEQERAGIDIVTDGEQSRQHFVHGFLESLDGIDFAKRVTIGIRADRYKAEVPTVVGPVRRRAPVHVDDVRWARAHTTRKLKFTMPGPMTIVDTLADEHYGNRKALAMDFARALNEEARELVAAGLDVVQLDEPAFNVYMDDVAAWGIEALHRAIDGLGCTTAVHICYGSTSRPFRCWRAAASIRSRSSARTHACRSRCSDCSTAKTCWSDASTSRRSRSRRRSKSPRRSARRWRTCRPSVSTRARTAEWFRSHAPSRAASSPRSAKARASSAASSGKPPNPGSSSSRPRCRGRRADRPGR